MARHKALDIPDELLEQLLVVCNLQSALGRDGLVEELKRALAERLQNAETNHYLDGEAAEGRANSRNDYSRKTLLTESAKLPISMPRGRLSTFNSQLIAKHRRRLSVEQRCCPTNDKIVSMYASITVWEIPVSSADIPSWAGHLAEFYGIDVSPDLVSAVTDAILDEFAEWQSRPLEAVYPLVFFDVLRVKVRNERIVRNKVVYLALGVRTDGRKEILGLWIEQTEGAKFWLRVMAELKNRSVEDIIIAVVEGLKGFPDAITAVFQQAQVQTCIVHLIRNSLDFVSYKDRKAVAAALRDIHRAKDANAGAAALDAFAKGEWGLKYPVIAMSWRRHWPAVIPFFAFPIDARRIIYTTNAIEALNAKLRRAVMMRDHFPTDDAALKLLFLVNLAEREWRMPPQEWSMAKAQFSILFGDRFQAA